MEKVIDNILNIKEKKSLAKQCIDSGYSAEWHSNDDIIRVYTTSKLSRRRNNTEISANILVGRESSAEYLGRIRHLVISINPNNPKWEPIFSYPGELDELHSVPDAKKLYDDMRRIFI